jgi:signal transduction histidine kinase
VAAKAMFISGPDLRALAVILAGAGTVGAVEAAVLGGRVARAGRDLGEVARRLGGEGDFTSRPARRAGSELEALAAELEATSARLDASNRRAAALEQSRRELIAWVSHDLRTPLTGVKAMVEALVDGVVNDPETVDRYHSTIRSEVDQLASLVADLFELSTIQAGSLTAERRLTDFPQLVADAVAGVSATAAARGVRVVLGDMPERALVSVWPPSITRAVRNLLDNAVRHTPALGEVDVELGTEAGWTSVSVLDQCGGIPDSVLPHVFETGYRGDPARTPRDGGAGLGLAIARGLVDAHGGLIDVVNRAAGCAFTVRLPTARVPPPVEDARAGPQRQARRAAHRAN